MRRVGGLWSSVVEFSELRRAALRAARGKRAGRGVLRFLLELEPRLLAIQRQLVADRWRPGRCASFEILDPKRRRITAVPFTDRVVQHALMAQLQPVFERRMIGDSFACRPGLGVAAALSRAQALLRRHRFYLKLDVAGFFPSLSHRVVRDTLGRVIKDRRVLRLCDRIIDGPEPIPGQEPPHGLPIGSLTSQWFANDKQELWRAHAALECFLDQVLELRLKTRATLLAPSSEGLPFLGWRLFGRHRRVLRQNLRRYRWRLRLRRWQLRRGRIEPAHYLASVRAVLAHLAQGDTRRLRLRLLAGDDFEL